MRISIFLVLVIATSCGLVQGYFGNPESNYDREFHESRLREINAKKETKQRDSLTRLIETASTQFPSDLTEMTLIVETYNYKDYLDIQSNKFHTVEDSKRERKYYAQYDKDKKLLLKNYKHKVIYADQSDYDSLDRNEFRYVLKTTTKVTKDEEVLIYKDGGTSGWASTILYYIYDRQTGRVFGEIDKMERVAKL
jgi:glycyl-tRNA synthetase (class II)